MLSLEIAATQSSNLRQDGPPKQVFGLLPCGLAPVSVFVFLRNIHLFHKSAHRLTSERVRRVSVQYSNDVVQRGPGLLLVHLRGSSELNTFLPSTWGGKIFPVPALSVLFFQNPPFLFPLGGH